MELSTAAQLDTETLYSEVLLLLLEAKDCIHREPASQKHQHLQSAGFKKLPQLYESALRDLQAMEGLQSLRLPVALTGRKERVGPAFEGSTNNLAGVSEDRFVSANAPGLSTRQGWHAELIPELEERLTSRCKWIARIMEFPGGLDALEAAVAEEVDSLDAAHHQNSSLVVEVAEDLRCYLTLLAEFADRQAAFIRERKLGAQQALDLRESSYQKANCKAQMLKVEAIQKRLLSFTYTDQTVPALRAVSNHLGDAEQAAEQEHRQLSGRMSEYEALGPEFRALAERYQRLLGDLRHAEFTLEELRQTAAAQIESP